MKNMRYLFLILLFLSSCQSRTTKETKECTKAKVLTKLEQFYLLPTDSVMNMCDLSNDSIVGFPDLSAYTIKSLDLSHNLLDTIIIDNLPKELERLNLSYNQYKGDLQIEEKTIPCLKEINMSHNDLKGIDISEPLYRILLSYNDLTIACFNHKNLCYLDVSYNCNMPSEVCFEPTEIDTVIRDGVAEGKRLVGPISVRYYNPID